MAGKRQFEVNSRPEVSLRTQKLQRQPSRRKGPAQFGPIFGKRLRNQRQKKIGRREDRKAACSNRDTVGNWPLRRMKALRPAG